MMIRGAVVVACLVGAVCAPARDDKDPVREKLFAAKVAYDAEMKEYRKSAGEWFDTREGDARKNGNKKLVDQIKAERGVFDESGVLPKGAPAAVAQKAAGAKKTLEAAYDSAVQAYTKTKMDSEAAAVEAEWKTFVRGSAIALLAFVDPKAHAVAGEWKKDGKVLIGTATGKPAVLQLPYEPGEEYDLEVICRRIEGNDGLCVGLTAGGRQVAALLDGWPNDGYLSGFDQVDKKAAKDNTTAVKGGLLTAGRDHTITCSVRSGKIDLSVNGKIVTSFKGNFNRLSLFEGGGGPNKKALFLHHHGTFKFDRVAVTPVKGQGAILK